MNKDEFKQTALRRGYARATDVMLFVKDNQKEDYTEDDLYDLYRFAERRKEPMRRNPIRLGCEDEEYRKQLIRDSWLGDG